MEAGPAGPDSEDETGEPQREEDRKQVDRQGLPTRSTASAIASAERAHSIRIEITQPVVAY